MVVSIRSFTRLSSFCTKRSSTYVRHIIKVNTSDRHDTDSESHPVVKRKMRSAGLYSTARYGLYFEKYIDGSIINPNSIY